MLSRYLIAVFTAGAAAQSAVSQSLFNNFVKYTAFASGSYAEDCPTPPYGSSIVRTFNDSATDTKAVLFRDAASSQLILSFRGSATPTNLDQDVLFTLVNPSITGISCSGCKVHAGFQNAYNRISSAVSSAVSSAQAQNPGDSLIVTGHSLGAALAALSASSLAGQGKSVTVYTFGEPRNGNAAFATYINRQIPNYYRVTHANDGVPQIPPALLGYSHHGTEYWERNLNGNTAATTLNCGGGEPTGCNAAQDYGNSAINGAHIAYSNSLTANPLFNAACGMDK